MPYKRNSPSCCAILCNGQAGGVFYLPVDRVFSMSGFGDRGYRHTARRYPGE